MKKTKKFTRTSRPRSFKKGLFEILLFNEDIEMYDSFAVPATSEKEALEEGSKRAKPGWKPIEVRVMRNKNDLYYYNEGACFVCTDL